MNIESKIEEIEMVRKLIGEIIKYLRKIRMTFETFRKINLYHDIIKEIMGSPYEIGGLLLNDVNKNDNVCRDAILINKQNISDSQTDEHNVLDTYNIAKKNNMKVIGPWHSHGDIFVFHSPIDEVYIKSIYSRNIVSLPNYIPLGWNSELFGRDLVMNTENGVLTVQKNGSVLDRYLELIHKKPSKINLEFKKDIDTEWINLLKSYLKDSLLGITFSSEKGLFYAQSVVINENTARLVDRIDKNVDVTKKCSLRTLIQKEPYSDEFIELGDNQLELELIDETNNIVLDEKILREEIYDSVYVGGVPIKDLMLRKDRPIPIEKIIEKEEHLKEQEKNIKRIESVQLDDVKRQRLEELKILNLPNYDDQHINAVLNAEKIAEENEPDNRFLSVLKEGYYVGIQILKPAKKRYEEMDQKTKEKLNGPIEYLTNIVEGIKKALKKGYKGNKRKFFDEAFNLSQKTIRKLMEGKPLGILPDAKDNLCVDTFEEKINTQQNGNLEKDKANSLGAFKREEILLLKEENAQLKGKTEHFESELKIYKQQATENYSKLEKKVKVLEEEIGKLKETQKIKSSEESNIVYSKLNNLYLNAVHGLKNKISNVYSNLKQKIKKGKRAIVVGAAIGTISLMSILGWYSQRSKELNIQPPPIVHVIQEQKHNSFYTIHAIKKGDTLWAITRDYLGSHNMGVNNSNIYLMTDKLAELNGKGKQASYQIGVWDEKSPHFIRAGDEIKAWK